jgi:Restriction endonuclease
MAARKSNSTRPKEPRTTIEFDEIPNWQAFEDLVADYFRGIKEQKNIIDITVEQSGEGADGGRDILITFQLTDSIISFQRKWVIQCKFYDRSVSKAELSDINIPTLIHEYGADGYLLMCKGNVTSPVSTMFESLRKKCKMGYSYMYWTGNQFKDQLYIQPIEPLIQKHFPEYYRFLKSLEGGEA